MKKKWIFRPKESTNILLRADKPKSMEISNENMEHLSRWFTCIMHLVCRIEKTNTWSFLVFLKFNYELLILHLQSMHMVFGCETTGNWVDHCHCLVKIAEGKYVAVQIFSNPLGWHLLGNLLWTIPLFQSIDQIFSPTFYIKFKMFTWHICRFMA